MRKVYINNEEWKYRIGALHVVIIFPDEKKGHFVDFPTLTGKSWNEIEKIGYYKNYFNLTASKVKEYITKELIKEERDE